VKQTAQSKRHSPQGIILAVFFAIALLLCVDLTIDRSKTFPGHWRTQSIAHAASLVGEYAPWDGERPDVVNVAGRAADDGQVEHRKNGDTDDADGPISSAPPVMASISGLRPFGVPLRLTQQTEPSDTFTITFGTDGGTIKWVTREGQLVIVSHPGWMNLNYVWNEGETPGFPRAVDDDTSADTMKEGMASGWLGTLYADCEWDAGCRYGDYVSAKPDRNLTVVKEVPLQSTFYVPIYDAFPGCRTEIPYPKPPCPIDSDACYHIVGFAAIEVPTHDAGEAQITARWVSQVRPNILYLRKAVTPSTARPGQVITYTLRYANHGPQIATGVVITDDVPILLTNLVYTYAGAQITATASSSYTWQVRDLDVGEGGVITISAQVAADAIVGVLTNTATITAAELDLTSTSNTDRATVDVVHLPGVTLGPDHVDSADPGSVVTYTHVLTNTGDDPDLFTLDTVSSQGWTVTLMGGAHSAGTPSLPLQLDAGAQTTFVVSITVPGDSSGLTDVTTVTATSQADTSVWATANDTTHVAVWTPNVPVLQAPPNHTVTTDRAVTFTWIPATTGIPPTAYNLRLDGTSVITTTATVSPAILSIGLHTWTVRAYNDFGHSSWAETWQVEIVPHRIHLPLVLRDN
jgi:uncharacterized repeat protein (TIGR01451 family)